MKKLAFLLGVTIAIFATANIASAIQTFNDSISVPALKVGSQGSGGVTYFNGSIVNETTGTNDSDNPVTFGDNVRIDGTIFRGATAGSGDEKPLKLNDDVTVYGNLTLTSGRTLDVTNVDIEGLSISADQIADVTRRVALPLNSFFVDADGSPAQISSSTTPSLTYLTNQGLAAVWTGTGSADIGTNFTVPEDYQGDGVIKAIVDISDTGSKSFNLQLYVAVADVDSTWDSGLTGEDCGGIPETSGMPSEFFCPIVIGDNDLSAGDLLFVKLAPRDRDPGGEYADLELYAAWFEYTAIQ